MLTRLRALFSEHSTIALTGCSGAGKTTLARELLQSGTVPGLTVLHGDSTLGLPWAEQPRALIAAAGQAASGRLLVEWVQVPRAVRKGLKTDLVVIVPTRGTPTQAQLAQWRGQLTVLSELAVPVVRLPPTQ